MNLIFISPNEEFVAIMKSHGYSSFVGLVETFSPTKMTFYVSPANSFGFMDGGVDIALCKMMPGIEQKLKKAIANLGYKTKLGRPYLPIGSALIVDHSETMKLIAAPTMLLPQDITSVPENVYYATMATLALLAKQNQQDMDIIFTSMGCGYGKLSDQVASQQILHGIRDYNAYLAKEQTATSWICEPNLPNQPKIYMNTEFGLHLQ